MRVELGEAEAEAMLLEYDHSDFEGMNSDGVESELKMPDRKFVAGWHGNLHRCRSFKI